MIRLLLDLHIALAVVPALHRLLPNADAEHVARWHNGALRTAPDDEILRAAATEERVRVTFDGSIVHPLVDEWIASPRKLPGVIFCTGSASDVGGIARGLAEILSVREALDPDYPVMYLRPIAR